MSEKEDMVKMPNALFVSACLSLLQPWLSCSVAGATMESLRNKANSDKDFGVHEGVHINVYLCLQRCTMRVDQCAL